jgi:uncharacterized protein (DUF2235 family)
MPSIHLRAKRKWRSFIERALATEAPKKFEKSYERKKRSHIILLDGTVSTLKIGQETNIGLIYKLLGETTASTSIHYGPGLQWGNLKSNLRVITGEGLGNQIREAYGVLSSRYQEGDDIFIFGYSRGAFAARSLCGIIEKVGLLTAEEATTRNIALAWRLYQARKGYKNFRKSYCHKVVQIEMLGVFETVSALGIKWPLLWKFLSKKHNFHDHQVCSNIKAAYHALALDETRLAYTPECWNLNQIPKNTVVEQVWFRGTHGDVGGNIGDCTASRRLSNIPLVWMLENAEKNGMKLPNDWAKKFPQDPNAPSVGTFRGLGKFLIFRADRRVALSDHEWVHPSAIDPKIM